MICLRSSGSTYADRYIISAYLCICPFIPEPVEVVSLILTQLLKFVECFKIKEEAGQAFKSHYRPITYLLQICPYFDF